MAIYFSLFVGRYMISQRAVYKLFDWADVIDKTVVLEDPDSCNHLPSFDLNLQLENVFHDWVSVFCSNAFPVNPYLKNNVLNWVKWV